MADNARVNPSTGADAVYDFRFDELAGGVLVPYTKVDLGGDGLEAPWVASTTVPANNVPAPPVRLTGQDVWNVSFADSGASVLAPEFTLIRQGTGVGYSQASSALVVTTGTTTNAEFLVRSTRTWQGSLRAKVSTVLSQRIVNQNFTWMLADLIGQALNYNIVNTTTVDVTLTAHGFTAQAVGQFMFLGGITGAAGVPGRYAIASIPDVNTIRFTVAGWPASGTGTLTLFGHSCARVLYSGATATAAIVSVQRRGWADADVALTINSTASPGHVVHQELTGRECVWWDQLRASSTAPTATTRGNRIENLPDDNLDLYLFLWSFNGTVAPASTTTWTVGFVSVEKFANQPVYIQGARATGSLNPLPVTIQGAVDTEFATAAALADGAANPTTGTAGSAPLEFNGTTWDRLRGNTAVSVEASSAKTASGNSAAAITNHSARGAVLFINVTAATGTTPTLVVRAQMQDPVGSGWVDIPGAATASITTTGLTALAIYPGATVAANAAVSYPLPRTWRLAWTITGTTPSFTFSVGAQYVK